MAHASGNPTWVDYPDLSTMVSAAALERVEALLDRLTNPPVFSAYQTVKQTLANGAIAGITFDQEVIDTHNGHDPVTNRGRYTIPAGWSGTYVIRAQVMIQNYTGRRVVWVYKNGAATPGGLSIMSPSTTSIPGNQSSSMAMTVIPAAAGDYIEVMAYQDSGGALDTTVAAAGDYASSLALFYLRP